MGSLWMICFCLLLSTLDLLTTSQVSSKEKRICSSSTEVQSSRLQVRHQAGKRAALPTWRSYAKDVSSQAWR